VSRYSRTQRTRAQTRCEGFTLFEVMMAVLVLGTALVGLVRMLDLGRLGLDADTKRVAALSLLRHEAALVKARGYESLANEAATSVAAEPGYARSLSVVYAGGGLKLVTVTVSWKSPTGKVVSESAQLLVADTQLPMGVMERQ